MTRPKEILLQEKVKKREDECVRERETENERRSRISTSLPGGVLRG